MQGQHVMSRTFDIVKKNAVPDSFRLQKLKADFGVSPANGDEHFTGAVEMPEAWQIGVIVGGSGTGKTTIARELFGADIVTDFGWTDAAVIDNMPQGHTVEDIERVFYAVGFGSVPCWTKPYKVLSNGEKMRVTLARAILERDFFAFDEFTSVVDRQVAKTLCLSLTKCLKRYPQKRVVLITCHKDVLDWLTPDWTFTTDGMRSDFFQHARNGRKSPSRCAVVGWNFGECLAAITI